MIIRMPCPWVDWNSMEVHAAVRALGTGLLCLWKYKCAARVLTASCTARTLARRRSLWLVSVKDVPSLVLLGQP